MPTYEYLCRVCEHQFEKFQSMKAKPLRKCPECGGKVQRLIGAGGGIIFKGRGFYQTDYRSKSYQEGAKKDQPKSESQKETKKNPADEKGASQKKKEKTEG